MINAIITGISNALYNEFGYENHMEEIKQDLVEPCFFISCVNPTNQKYPGIRYFRENQFVIQYFPESKDKANAECYEVAERMLVCLEVIQVDNGPIRGRKMNYKIVDGILHFFVNYDCFIYSVKQEIPMGGVETHVKVKG